MKNKFTASIVLFLFVLVYSSVAQTKKAEPEFVGGEFSYEKYSAENPEITPKQYEMLDKQCAQNIKIFGLDKIKKSTNSVLLNWPLKAATGFTDCSYYIATAYVDENTAAGAISDWHCGTNTYDGHQGTDICIWPFPFYKMDNNQIEVIAAAAGTILAKSDGHFDRNCASNNDTANYIIIQHADGSCALYWHMKSGSVTTKAISQTVTVGEYLGCVGSSGSSTGPHLHFEVWNGTFSSSYKDPYSGTCNTLNSNSWWASQKPYTEPAIIKASVHITDVVVPACPSTETPNESSTYQIPFQGPGLNPGYAKFYIFLRDEVSGTVVNCSILNPGGSTFNSWIYNCNNSYNGSYFGFSKLLPTNPGTYTFQATYNNITCSQSFNIITAAGVSTNTDSEKLNISPNPASSTINISGEDMENGNYIFLLKNVLGQTIINENALVENKAVQKRLSISELSNGVYFLLIENNKSKTVRKIIKQN